jgi:hypothetical protein
MSLLQRNYELVQEVLSFATLEILSVKALIVEMLFRVDNF